MFPLGYFIIALARVLDTVLFLYFWIVIVQAVLSWVNPDPYNRIVRTIHYSRIVRTIHNLTEPVLRKIRSRLPVYYGGIDFSPFVVILGIYFLRIFLVQSLARFGSSLI